MTGRGRPLLGTPAGKIEGDQLPGEGKFAAPERRLQMCVRMGFPGAGTRAINAAVKDETCLERKEERNVYRA